MTASLIRYRESLWILGVGLFVYLLAFITPVENGNSDPFFSLIVTEAILEQGTIKLDTYYASQPDLFEDFFWQVGKYANGHYYYNYPVGTSLFSIPFVAAADLMGREMADVVHNFKLQNLISAILCASVFLLIYRISRYYLSPVPSLIISSISVLGSSLVSTMGTALWNMDFTVFFICLSLLLVCRFDAGRSDSMNGYLLGFFLFAAFLSRSSASIFIVVTFAYLLIRDRQALVRSAITSALLLALYAAATQFEYGQLFNQYYSPTRWFYSADIWKPLYGVLFSPSRGLFIYSPFLLLAVAAIPWTLRRTQRSPLVWLSCLWIGLQILAVATTRQWNGGFSYGPRLLADAVPAFVILTIFAWHKMAPELTTQKKAAVTTVYVLLGAFGIFVNSFQGLFNINVNRWNGTPHIVEFPEYLFDWKYPQFLVTAESFHARRLEHALREMESGSLQLESIMPGETLTLEDEGSRALFIGWWNTGWTETRNPKVLFVPEDVNPDARYTLAISSAAIRPQEAIISINGTEIGSRAFDEQLTTQKLDFDGVLLTAGRINEIEFHLPNASFPNLEEMVRLGKGFVTLRLGLTSTSIVIAESQ